MAVDLHIGERRELAQRRRILVEHPRHIHELGKPQHLGMMLEGQQVLGLQPGARRLEMRGRHAGRKLHAQVHHRDGSALQEIFQPDDTEDVADLMGVANRRRRAARHHAAVEFQRRHQGRFAMDVAVDEAWHRDQTSALDLSGARIGFADADDAVARNGDVAGDNLTRREVEDADALDHQVGGRLAARLVDDVGQSGLGERLSHGGEIKQCFHDRNAASSHRGRLGMNPFVIVLIEWPRLVAAYFTWLPPLVARIVVGWVFLWSGWGKLNLLPRMIENFPGWGIPYPEIVTPFVPGVEFVGGILLLVGLFTRIAAAPLMVVMVVAIISAKAAEVDSLETLLGFEETAYFALFFWLAIAGPGPISLDWLLTRNRRERSGLSRIELNR